MTMKIRELMKKDVTLVSPDSTVREAALKMKEHDIGVLPVCGNDKLVGLVTDRDLVIRAVAENRECLQTQIKDVMTSPIIYCFEDQDAEEIARIMEVKQIRRLVVLDRNKRLVGIVSVDDLARNQALAGEVLSQVTESMHRRAA
jgi:CBS domain-containing protein